MEAQHSIQKQPRNPGNLFMDTPPHSYGPSVPCRSFIRQTPLEFTRVIHTIHIIYVESRFIWCDLTYKVVYFYLLIYSSVCRNSYSQLVYVSFHSFQFVFTKIISNHWKMKFIMILISDYTYNPFRSAGTLCHYITMWWIIYLFIK